MKFLSLDSPFINFMSRVADLMILNIITLVLCIPLVTAGAAFAALHYMSLKIIRNEETYIVRGYFKAFKENFKQATIVWLIILLAVFILITDFIIILQSGMEFYPWLKLVLLTVSVLVVFMAVMVFPVMAKFSNTTFHTMKNALGIAVLQFPKTILMIIAYLIPLVALYYNFEIFPFVLMFGISVPAMVSAGLYNKFFKKLETRILEAQEEAGTVPEEEEDDGVEKIFSDTLDESLIDKNM